MPNPLQRIVIVGDSSGVPELLARIPADRVVAIVAAAIRPQFHGALQRIADELLVPLLVQPLAEAAEYPGFLHALQATAPDSLLCHSYSMLLRPDVLALAPDRAFNVHAALLPRHRGPNPIQWALIHGDDRTGVTLHLMDDAFDRGAIVDQESVQIHEDDTWRTVAIRVHDATAVLLDRALPALLEGRWTATPQDESRALLNARIQSDSFPIDFGRMSDRQIVDLIRAQVAPLQGAWLDTSAGRLRFTEALNVQRVAELRARHHA